MKKHILSITAALSALVLSSCFHHETTIHLKKDGSGTIVEETRMSTEMLDMVGELGEELINGLTTDADDVFPEVIIEKDPSPLDVLLSEDRARKRAAQLGEGVTVVKIEPVTVGASKGARVTYHFTDINKLRVYDNESMEEIIHGISDEDKPSADDSTPITFTYKDGILTIRPNTKKADKNSDAQDEADAAAEIDAEEMAMMKEMFADMKMSFKLVIEDGIAETNATHRDGDTITLKELDMNKLMENPDNIKKIHNLDDHDNPAAAMEAFNGIDGVKIELNPEVTVKLK